jgi:ureidoglycolate dehydrogenase (NAD+)
VASVLAGALVGGKMPLHKGWKFARDGSEHFFTAVDVSQFVEPERFYDEVDRTAAEIRALPPAAGFDRVFLPGELEHERAERCRREGLSLHREHVRTLEELAAEMKLPVPW